MSGLRRRSESGGGGNTDRGELPFWQSTFSFQFLRFVVKISSSWILMHLRLSYLIILPVHFLFDVLLLSFSISPSRLAYFVAYVSSSTEDLYKDWEQESLMVDLWS